MFSKTLERIKNNTKFRSYSDIVTQWLVNIFKCKKTQILKNILASLKVKHTLAEPEFSVCSHSMLTGIK